MRYFLTFCGASRLSHRKVCCEREKACGDSDAGLIDWRGIDTPNYHCWPPSPVNGSMGGTVQLVSALAGISPQILKIGNRVKIIAHPSRDKSQRTAEFMGMEVNGRYYSRGTGSNIRGKGEN